LAHVPRTICRFLLFASLPCVLMAEHLAVNHNFIVCDGLSPELPIRYVSDGFTDLFGYDVKEAAGMSCGQLIGASCIMSNSLSLHRACQLSDLDVACVKNSIEFMTQHVAEEMQRMVADSSSNPFGFGVFVSRNGSGEVIVCELVLRSRRHPSCGWKYAIGLLRNISSKISVGEVLRCCASNKGQEYLYLLSQHRNQAYSQAKVLDTMQAACLVDEIAVNTWKAMTRDAMQHSGKKATSTRSSSPCSLASRSTASGRSCESSSTMSSIESRIGTVSKLSCSSGTFRQKSMKAPLEVQSPSSAGLQSPKPDVAMNAADCRFLDLLEEPEGLDASEEANDISNLHPDAMLSTRTSLHRELETPNEACAFESTQDFSSRLQQSVKLLGREALFNLGFPFSIADPSLVDCPAVACSSAFTALTGYCDEEILGKSWRLLLDGVPGHLVNKSAMTACSALCDASSRGTWFNTPIPGCMLCELARNPEQVLADGELYYVQTHATKTGELFRCMVFLKQVELDDQCFIVGLQARVPDKDLDPEEHDRDAQVGDQERHQQACACLAYNMDVTEQVLASEYWYCAAMRRQVSQGFDGETCTFGPRL